LVRIDNDFGDVKVGRQATCCYQRNYGRQVRRVVRPKSGTPTKPQNTQRQRFVAGLSFRKNLSHTAKVYLDGYCIAHQIRDDYGVPLTWDKFAMKIALEAPRLAVLM
jgi:hypothetical protein